MRYLRKDGGFVWCETRARTLPDEDGKGGVRLVVSLRDISKRVLVEQERDASEALYRLVAENVSEVVYTSDGTGRFTWVSPSVETELGWAPDEARRPGHGGPAVRPRPRRHGGDTDRGVRRRSRRSGSTGSGCGAGTAASGG